MGSHSCHWAAWPSVETSDSVGVRQFQHSSCPVSFSFYRRIVLWAVTGRGDFKRLLSGALSEGLISQFEAF